jgi:hypothetical protein
MKFSVEQYKTLSGKFNKMTFLHKLITIKNNKELFVIETDGYNIRLRLLDEEAMINNIDSYFLFPEFLEYSHLRDIFSLSDITVKELK